ncbi:hypothetical protein L210DRAFT_3644066 [Boletus edulis BED1]|uniref:IPT/TIG domain-containing protein n=1 Tax=Boletus edulis BED1 TaxID=1328754 RepID=A0AAD4GGY1_BOLED|nr:hypothetical protein L210DRAFT_3644066 [Boletus edulis BED1]
MFAKLSALALFLASAAAQSTITVPDQADWGDVILVKFGGFVKDVFGGNVNVDLILTGMNTPQTYLIGYQTPVYSGVIKVVLPYVVDQGAQYQLVAANLNEGYDYARSNIITVN